MSIWGGSEKEAEKGDKMFPILSATPADLHWATIDIFSPYNQKVAGSYSFPKRLSNMAFPSLTEATLEASAILCQHSLTIHDLSFKTGARRRSSALSPECEW